MAKSVTPRLVFSPKSWIVMGFVLFLGYLILGLSLSPGFPVVWAVFASICISLQPLLIYWVRKELVNFIDPFLNFIDAEKYHVLSWYQKQLDDILRSKMIIVFGVLFGTAGILAPIYTTNYFTLEYKWFQHVSLKYFAVSLLFIGQSLMGVYFWTLFRSALVLHIMAREFRIRVGIHQHSFAGLRVVGELFFKLSLSFFAVSMVWYMALSTSPTP